MSKYSCAACDTTAHCLNQNNCKQACNIDGTAHWIFALRLLPVSQGYDDLCVLVGARHDKGSRKLQASYLARSWSADRPNEHARSHIEVRVHSCQLRCVHLAYLSTYRIGNHHVPNAACPIFEFCNILSAPAFVTVVVAPRQYATNAEQVTSIATGLATNGIIAYIANTQGHQATKVSQRTSNEF